MTFRYRDQVEGHLGRPLTDAEIQEVGSLEELTDEQVAVVAAIRPSNRIAPMLYLQAIVPSAARNDVLKFIDDDITRVAAERLPPEELPNQQMFEDYAGRALHPTERVRVDSFEKMSHEQIELARTLARANIAAGFLYLSRIVPAESTERRHELAKHLAESKA